MMDVVWPAEFAAAGWVENLHNFFPEDQRSDFFPGAIDACTFRGGLYGIPFWTSGGLLYYRKDLLARYGLDAPKTWQELTHQARIIVEGERERNPAVWGYSGQFKQYEGLVCDMQEFVLSNGGKLLSDDGLRSTIRAPKTVEAVRFVRDHVIGNVAPRGVLTYEEPESLHLFVQGHAVFLRNWPYAWKIANDPDRSRVAGLVEITVLPHFIGGESVSTLGGWQFAISRFSQKKQTAWKFVQFMTSPRIQKLLAIEASQAPARRSVYKDPEVLAENPHFLKLFKVFETARPRPHLPLYPLYSAILQRFYHQALAFPDSSIEELAAEADRQVEELLELQREAGM
jgi:multiple sugar transport system substrate-binding protein